MLKMVICCGGGMSSSVLAMNFQKTIEEKKWQDKVTVRYMPLLYLKKHQDEFDIAMLCPHLLYHAKEMAEKKELTIPMYLIPAKIYGKMELRPLVEDAIDILKLYEKTHENPIHFPNENFLEVTRNTSHRRWIKAQK